MMGMKYVLVDKKKMTAPPLVFSDPAVAEAEYEKQKQSGKDVVVMTEHEWMLMMTQPWRRFRVQVDEEDDNLI